ncbi:uncharacterized protein TNCV_65781 [Trichonephila clavipes]|nr:uncharacterized protein TNCV_65781 [Trichonephila clavipes]
MQPLMVCREGILYKGNLACNLRCSRCQEIDKTDISTPVPVDQHSTNYLEEAVRHSSPALTFHRPLPVFRVVRCSPVHCFQTRITVELFRCTQAPIARLKNSLF